MAGISPIIISPLIGSRSLPSGGSPTIQYIQATGGEISYIPGFKIHRLNSTTDFIITQEGSEGYNDLLVEEVGAGGGGVKNAGGGRSAGAGGGKVKTFTLPAAVGTYVGTVGVGGAVNLGFANGANGGDTSIFGITAKGGGGAGNSTLNGSNGGNGGGGGNTGGADTLGGTSTDGGYSGGKGKGILTTGGGGGDQGAGGDGDDITGYGGDGGPGFESQIIPGLYLGVGASGSGLVSAGAQGSPGGAIGGTGGGAITEPDPNTGNGGASGFDGNYGCDGADGTILIMYPYDEYVDTDLLLELNFPALNDTSGNGLNSSLGSGLVNGFTAPTNVSSDLVFNGDNAIKLNSRLFIDPNHCTVMLPFYTDAPEETQGLFNLGLNDYLGSRIYVEDGTYGGSFNRYVVFGGVNGIGASDEPNHGKSFPKIQGGYNLIGISYSTTQVAIYVNGVVNYYSPNSGTLAGIKSGWLGGIASNTYTLPFYGKLINGTYMRVYNRTLSLSELQTEGDSMATAFGWSQIVFEGDSITEGFTLATNGDNWCHTVCETLIANTSYKFSPLNIGIPSQTLQSIATNCVLDGATVPYLWDQTISSNYPRAYGTKVYVLLGGINDIAVGRTLGQMEADLATIITAKVGQGYTCYVLTITGDSAASGGQETQRLNYNSYILANEALGYTAIDICANPNLAGQPSGADAYFSDGIHWTALTCGIVAAIVEPVIEADL